MRDETLLICNASTQSRLDEIVYGIGERIIYELAKCMDTRMCIVVGRTVRSVAQWSDSYRNAKEAEELRFLMEDSEDDPSRKEGMFVKAKYNTNVRPFSCYLEYNGELTGTQTTARRKASAEELPDVIEIEWKSAAEAPGETTGIDELRIKNLELRGEGWYSLDGRRLSGRPTAKGLYIHNGKLVIKN